jgi:hypothetical protein
VVSVKQILLYGSKRASCSESAACRLELATAELPFLELAEWVASTRLLESCCLAAQKIAVRFTAFSGRAGMSAGGVD